MGDAWRLAVGTLTALPVAAPRSVDRQVSGRAMVLAPLAAVPLGTLVAAVCWAGRELGLAPLAVAAVAIGMLAMGSRALHLDGLCDAADGLTASYDPARSLAVMKGGTAGPAGAAMLVVVLGVQAASLATVMLAPWGPVAAGLVVCCSRSALVLACARGVRAARVDGLGTGYAGTVDRRGVAAVWLVTAAVLIGAAALADLPWWRGAMAAAVTLAVIGLLLVRCLRRFGGVTGDVFGAAIELTLAALLLTLT